MALTQTYARTHWRQFCGLDRTPGSRACRGGLKVPAVRITLSAQVPPVASALGGREATRAATPLEAAPMPGQLGRRAPERSAGNLQVVQAEPPQAVDGSRTAKLAVFVSGGGSNFRAIHAACQAGKVAGEVVAVVSDKAECGGVTYAKEAGIPTFVHPPPKDGTGGGQAEVLEAAELTAKLKDELQVDYVLLAGYLKLIPEELVKVYTRGMLNIHPGLLPSFGGKGFYGQRVHRAVIESGARFSGPTIHFVDAEYDTGPILAQEVVPVLPHDTPQTLAARVLKEEHKLYPKAVSALCDGRITWREDGIPMIWSAE